MFHSDSDSGFSLVEVIIVIGLVGVLLSVLALSLNAKEKQIRDVKRLNDMNSLRDALSVLKHETGGYEAALCSPGAIADCGRLANSRLKDYLPSLKNLKDPLNPSTLCADANACNSGKCEYTFVKFDETDYEVRFALEKGVDGFPLPGCYRLTSSGIVKL